MNDKVSKVKSVFLGEFYPSPKNAEVRGMMRISIDCALARDDARKVFNRFSEPLKTEVTFTDCEDADKVTLRLAADSSQWEVITFKGEDKTVDYHPRGTQYVRYLDSSDKPVEVSSRKQAPKGACEVPGVKFFIACDSNGNPQSEPTSQSAVDGASAYAQALKIAYPSLKPAPKASATKRAAQEAIIKSIQALLDAGMQEAALHLIDANEIDLKSAFPSLKEALDSVKSND